MEESSTHTISNPMHSMVENLALDDVFLGFRLRMDERLKKLRARGKGEGSEGKEDKGAKVSSCARKERVLS